MMRGDALLQLRMLRTQAGLAGLVGVAGGVLGVVGAGLPWYEVVNRVEMLGTGADGVIATLDGWHAHPWSMLAPVAAVVGAAVAAAHALDRPLLRGAHVLRASGLLLAALVLAAVAMTPGLERFDTPDSPVADLLRLAQDGLPAGVTVTIDVLPGVGLWVTLLSAVLLVGVARHLRV